jgi:hypothetical protein
LVLRELKQLNQYLESSTRATTDPNPLILLDKSDVHLLQNFKNLVRAAEDFCTSASTEATTLYGGENYIDRGTSQVHEYAQSNCLPRATSTKRRHIEMFLRRNQHPSRANSLAPSNGTLGAPNYPEVVDGVPMNLELDLDNLFSGGLSKMAQKDLRKFDFPKAEKILQQALERHRVSAPDDAYHSRLRTQLALCSFLQGKGPHIEESVIDLTEFRGTKQSVAHQLLYTLALSHMHELDFQAAQKICKRLWANLCRLNSPVCPMKNDLLRLLIVSYRMSGENILADAIEEEHPELRKQADDGLPSILESIIGCDALLVELFGVLDSSEIPQLLMHQFRRRTESAKQSPFDLRRIKQQMQKAMDRGSPASEYNGDASSRAPSSLRRVAMRDVTAGDNDHQKSSDNGRFIRLKALFNRRHTLTKVKSNVASASLDCLRSYGSRNSISIRRARHTLQKKEKTTSYTESKTGSQPWWKIAYLWTKKPMNTSSDDDLDDNGQYILSWLRGQDTFKRVPPPVTTVASNSDMSSSLFRNFSFMGMPSTPTEGPCIPLSMPRMEMHDCPLVEMMDTSLPLELADTGLSPFDIIAKHSHFSPCVSVTASSCCNTFHSNDKSSETSVLGTINSDMPVHTRRHSNLQQDGYSSSSAPTLAPLGTVSENNNELHGYYGSADISGRSKVASDVSIDESELHGYCSSKDISGRSKVVSDYSINGILLHGYYGPQDVPGYSRVVSDLSIDESMAQKQTVHKFSPGQIERNAIKRSSIPFLISTSNPKGPCLYRTQLIPKLRTRDRDCSLQRNRVRIAHASLKPEVNGGEQIYDRREIHQNGLVYDYFGPTAVPGPYTTDELGELPCNLERGAPIRPRDPTDIKAPVEIDSHEIHEIDTICRA